MGYQSVYDTSLRDPEQFWMQAAKAIDWVKPPSRALDASQAPIYHWFSDGLVNTCWNALDRHIHANRGDQIALIYDSPVTHTKTHITYNDLHHRVSHLAGALAARGLVAGDRVVIYMPMIPQALEAMLACARLGVIHSVVFGGFAAHELAVRIDDCTPKAILSASCGIEPGRLVPYKPLLDDALNQSHHQPEFCVIYQRDQLPADLIPQRDLDWVEFQNQGLSADCTPVRGDHPAYILYTSGTTGAPKGVVRTTGGHLVALQWSMKSIYNMDPGEVFWCASDVGWVVGHSYICYAPLIAGCTSVLYEGKPIGTPDAGAFWRVIQDHNVKSFFTAPTALRAIKRDDPEGLFIKSYPMPSLRYCYLAGERADPATIEWASTHLGVPVIDHWWQTETGWAIAANPVGIEAMAVKPGSPTRPMPGYHIEILDSEGHPLPPNELGAIAIKLPLPPGTLASLWQGDARFQSSYLEHYPGYYETGDAGYFDEDGYIYIMARTDDVINVAGHRLSTGAMEQVLTSHPNVAECAVIGVYDPIKGQSPIGLLCLNKGTTRDHGDIIHDCIILMRAQIGPVADFKRALVVDRLPKTRSGKILRATLTKIADGAAWKMPATIDDPAILDEIRTAFQTIGLAQT